MSVDNWRRNAIYRAITLTRQHSRACRGIDTREFLLAVERSLLRMAAEEGACRGVDDCSIKDTCRSWPLDCQSSGTLLRLAS